MATVRQKMAVQKIAEQVRKGKPISVKKAMIESGYSPKVANQASNKLLNTPGGKEELQKAFGRDYIHGKHQQNLEAYKFEKIPFGKMSPANARKIAEQRGYNVVSVNRDENQTTVVIQMPAYEYVDRAIDKVYKLNGAYEAEELTIKNKYGNLTDEELDAKYEELKKKLQK